MADSAGFELRPEGFRGATVEALLVEIQHEYVVRYGSPDDGPIDATEFDPPDGLFCVGYLNAEPVAMGGFRGHPDGVVELKRMYVRPEFRGRGLSRTLLAKLEQLARETGAVRVILETGLRQPEAMSLYSTSGYERIPGFGHYAHAPLSVSFGKALV